MSKNFNENAAVLRNRETARGIYLIQLKSPQIAKTAKPGQMVFIRVTKNKDPLLRRPFAVFNTDPGKGTVEVLYDVIGKGTGILSRKTEGETVEVIGPAGNGFALPDADEGSLIALAGGMGIAPIHFLIRFMEKENRKISLFYGAKDRDSFPVKDVGTNVKTFFATDNGSEGFHGFVTDLLTGQAEQFPENSILYACGPEIMMEKACGISRDNKWRVLVSLERHMACGVGACNGCVVRTKTAEGGWKQKRACKEGPVFNGEEIIWN